MSRRLISVLVTVFTVMLFATGCNSDQKAVTESVEGFLNAMVANDMEKASQYATEDFMKSDTMKLMQPDYLADTFYSAMGIEKDDLDEDLGLEDDEEYDERQDCKDYKQGHDDAGHSVFQPAFCLEEPDKGMNHVCHYPCDEERQQHAGEAVDEPYKGCRNKACYEPSDHSVEGNLFL